MSDDGEEDYVGYKHPPVRTRFQKGKSGNPAGRPKAKHLTIHGTISARLYEPRVIVTDGKRKTVTLTMVILRQMVARAMKGDINAAADLISILGERPHEMEPEIVMTYSDPD